MSKAKQQSKNNDTTRKVATQRHFPCWLSPVVCLVALAVLGTLWVTTESEYLWKMQELNLFLDTQLFFRQQMVVAGGMLTWLGTFFTEFFYHPWLGTTLLCAWWALLVWLTARAFRLPAKWCLLLLVPVAVLFVSNVSLGYWIYYLKLRGVLFVATIGLTAAVTALWGFRLVATHRFWGLPYILLSTLVLYPLAGFYGLLATLLMGIIVWRLSGLRLTTRTVTSVLAVACIIVVPLVFYRYVYYETAQHNIYFTGLPLFRIVDEYPAYYIPYYILAAWFTLLAATYRPDWTNAVRRPWLWALGQLGVAAIMVAGIAHFWYRDYNFHKELRMQRCLEQEDWQGMVSEAADLQDEPTRAIVMMKNLALFRLGRQGNEMYHYRTGAKASATPIPLRMTQVVGRAIYYNYGQLNYCYRWCLEDGVEMGWRVEYLKYLTRCAMVNGEWQVARKYINLLKHTRYYRQWAEEQERFVGDEKALRADAGYGPIFHMLNYDNQLSSDNSLVENYLMHMLANVYSDDPVMQEQTLLAALWTKDIATFWPRFLHYARLHPTTPMPKHYQEAAYLYGHLENQVDISRMPFDKDVVQSYYDFMALAQRCAGMTEEQMQPIFYPRFGHTFYYEYFLIRNQKLY